MGIEEQAKDRAIDEARLLAQKVRVQFLIANLLIVVLNMISGYVVYRQTNSITMELDLVGFVSDILALLVNMTVEVMKRHSSDPRRLFSLDLIGCAISMLALASMATWGCRNAWHREEDVDSRRKPYLVLTEDRVDHVGTMFIYSLFSLVLSLTTLSLFSCWFSAMYPHGFAEEDRLNTTSSLAHTIVDFAGTCTVLATSLAMLVQQEQGAARWKRFQENAHDDVVGTMVIVTISGLMICFLIGEAWKSFRLLQYLPPELDQDDRAVLAAAASSAGYGSTQA